MKLLKYVLLLLIIVVGVAPWGVGMLVENRYKQMYDQVKKLYADELDFSIEYTRGYLISIAKTEVVDPRTGQKIGFVDTIHNGPIIFDWKGFADASSYIPRGFKLAKVDTQFTGEMQQSISKLYGENEAYKITTIFEYAGNGQTTIRIFPLVTSSGGGQIDWQGGEYTLDFDTDFTDFKGQMNFPSLTYSEGNNSIKVSQVAGAFDNNLNSKDNSFDISVAGISIIEDGISTFDVRSINLKVKGTVKDKMLTGNLDYGMQEINAEGEQYGPIALNVTINNIDYELANTISKETEMGINNDENLLAFLKNQPMLNMVIAAVTPKGDINVASNLQVGGPDLQAVDEGSILQTLKVSVDLKVGKEIVDILLRQYVANEIATKEAMYFMQNRENTNADPNPYVMTEAELQTFTDEWVGEFYKYMLGDKYWLESGDEFTSNIKFDGGIITVNDAEKSQLDLEYLEASLDITVAAKPKSKNGNNNGAPTTQPLPQNTQQPPAQSDTIQAPPSQLQPMTEEEAQERLDAVPAPSTTSPSM